MIDSDNMDEKCAFDKVINVLTDHNLRLTKDYFIDTYSKGCFYIRFCSRSYVVLDVEYFYEMIPDITIFKIKQRNEIKKSSGYS